MIHTTYLAGATLTYGIDHSLRDPEMLHKVAVAVGLQLPVSGRLHTDTVWVAPMHGDTDVEIRERGVAAFLSFLGAAGESYRYTMQGNESDNSDLFPQDVMEWAYQNDDTISLACEAYEDDE